MDWRAEPIWAVVPVKDFARAKGRLADWLGPDERAGLARAMADDVLTALRGASVAARLCLLSDSNASRALALRHGADWIDEARVAEAAGLNAGIAGVARMSAAQGAGALLVVHADLPLLSAADIRRLVIRWRDLPGERRVALVRSRDGGSNLLLAGRPQQFEFSYGADSHARHLEHCRQQQRAAASLALPGAALDIDTGEDFERLIAAARAGQCGPHTAAFLGAIAAARPLLELAS